jgi:hypothetical protein
MWIFTSGCFVSIVEDCASADRLIVRGRFKGDVERFLNPLPSGVSVREIVTPAADYRFRATVDRSDVCAAVVRASYEVDYPNFKNSMKADWRHRVAMGVWSILHREQVARAPKPKAAQRSLWRDEREAQYGHGVLADGPKAWEAPW